MATEEVNVEFAEACARKRVEFWASSMDAFLQDFLSKAKADDKLGSIVACARLAQLSSAMQEEYEEMCNVLVDSDTELKVANQACEHVVRMIDDNSAQCMALKGESVPDTLPAPDPSMN